MPRIWRPIESNRAPRRVGQGLLKSREKRNPAQGQGFDRNSKGAVSAVAGARSRHFDVHGHDAHRRFDVAVDGAVHRIAVEFHAGMHGYRAAIGACAGHGVIHSVCPHVLVAELAVIVLFEECLAFGDLFGRHTFAGGIGARRNRKLFGLNRHGAGGFPHAWIDVGFFSDGGKAESRGRKYGKSMMKLHLILLGRGFWGHGSGDDQFDRLLSGEVLPVSPEIRGDPKILSNGLFIEYVNPGPRTTESAAPFGTFDFFGLASRGFGNIFFDISCPLEGLVLALENIVLGSIAAIVGTCAKNHGCEGGGNHGGGCLHVDLLNGVSVRTETRPDVRQSRSNRVDVQIRHSTTTDSAVSNRCLQPDRVLCRAVPIPASSPAGSICRALPCADPRWHRFRRRFQCPAASRERLPSSLRRKARRTRRSPPRSAPARPEAG